MRFKAQLAGFDAREIEDVVEQAEQGACRLLGLVGMVGLARLQGALPQQLEHAQHGVHRGADFMAHVGQEVRFGAIGRFRFAGAHFERMARGAPFAQVGRHAQVTDQGTVFMLERGHRQQYRHACAVLAQEGPFVFVGQAPQRLGDEYIEARRERLAQFARKFRGPRRHLVRVMKNHRRDPSDDLVGGMAEQALRRRIEDGDPAADIAGDDCIGGVVEDRLLLGRQVADLRGALDHLAFQRAVQLENLRRAGLLRADVAHGFGRADHLAAGGADRRNRHGNVDQSAVLAAPPRLMA